MQDNRATAQRFLAALERRDVSPIATMLADDVEQVLPFAPAGGTDPAAVFTGRERVLQVQQTIVDSFRSIAFAEQVYTVGDDGGTVFVESRGRRVHGDSGRIYENRYLLKFEFRDGLLRRITEYSNPVAFAAFFHLPLG